MIQISLLLLLFGEVKLHVTENYFRHLLCPDAELLQARFEQIWWSPSVTLHNFYSLLLKTTKLGLVWSGKNSISICSLIISYMWSSRAVLCDFLVGCQLELPV